MRIRRGGDGSGGGEGRGGGGVDKCFAIVLYTDEVGINIKF